MKVLWIPHTPRQGEGWDGSRQYHLFHRLGRRVDLVSVTWRQDKTLRAVPAYGSVRRREVPWGEEFTVQLAPNFYRLWTSDYPRPRHLALNQRLFRRAVREIVERTRPQVAVYSSSHHWTGFPPFDIDRPLVFDYIDRSPRWVEREFTRHAVEVMAVSDDLAGLLPPDTRHRVVPNGVDLTRYRAVERSEAKRRLGLEGRTVVSLIGLTCSASLYFLEAIAALQRDRDDLTLLIVGGGPVRDAILERCARLGIRDLVAPGAVDNREVHWHFAATDVGLYPGDDTPYFRSASPLKVVEYAAAGAQVVSSPVTMFERDWPSVRLVPATADAFRRAIRDALRDPRPAPPLDAFSWTRVTDQVYETLRDAAA